MGAIILFSPRPFARAGTVSAKPAENRRLATPQTLRTHHLLAIFSFFSFFAVCGGERVRRKDTTISFSIRILQTTGELPTHARTMSSPSNGKQTELTRQQYESWKRLVPYGSGFDRNFDQTRAHSLRPSFFVPPQVYV